MQNTYFTALHVNFRATAKTDSSFQFDLPSYLICLADLHFITIETEMKISLVSDFDTN